MLIHHQEKCTENKTYCTEIKILADEGLANGMLVTTVAPDKVDRCT